jgi:hypothetical protein
LPGQAVELAEREYRSYGGQSNKEVRRFGPNAEQQYRKDHGSGEDSLHK